VSEEVAKKLGVAPGLIDWACEKFKGTAQADVAKGIISLGTWIIGTPATDEHIYFSSAGEIRVKDMHYAHLANAINKMEREGKDKIQPVTFLAMKSELMHRDATMKIATEHDGSLESAPAVATTRKSPSGISAGGAIKDHLIGVEKHTKVMISAMKLGIPMLLIGETGTGKTSLAKLVGEHLARPIVRVNLDGGATPDELIGRYQLKGSETYFELGIVPKAMKEGAILILDELNAALPDTLFALHPLLEDPSRLLITETGEDIRPAKGFCVVATMNPSHEYAGTKQLNAALYSRFGVVLRFEGLKGEKLLRALTIHVPKSPADNVTKIAMIMETAERLRTADKITTRITMREGIAALTLAMDGLNLEESIHAAIGGKLEDYELKEVCATGVMKHSPATAHGLSKLSITEVLEAAARAQSLEKTVVKLEREMLAYSKLQAALKAMTEGDPLTKKEVVDAAVSASDPIDVTATVTEMLPVIDLGS
jgi:nitric oxide reductase NorQ protein